MADKDTVTEVESARLGDRWADIAGGLAFAALGLAIVVIGELTLREDIKGDLLGPMAFPRVLGGMLCVGGLYVAFRAWRMSADQSAIALDEEGDEDEADVPASTVRAFTVMATVAALRDRAEPLGYLVATPVFVAAGLFALSVRSKVVLVVVPLVLTAFCYYGFAEVLSVPLPSGVLTVPLRALGWAR